MRVSDDRLRQLHFHLEEPVAGVRGACPRRVRGVLLEGCVWTRSSFLLMFCQKRFNSRPTGLLKL